MSRLKNSYIRNSSLKIADTFTKMTLNPFSSFDSRK